MVKKILLNVSKIGNVVLAWFNFCLFFALRPCWSGISKKLEFEANQSWFVLNLPVIVCILFLLVALAVTFMYIFMEKEKNLWSYIFNGVSIVFFILNMVVVGLGAIDYMDYVWPEFFKLVGIASLVVFVIFLIFIYPRTQLATSKIFKFGFVGLFCTLIAVNIFNISINSITTGPVVYAVEDNYQIVFSSATNSRAWVTINGERHFDNYAGSNRSYTKIHKVTIPQNILDEAKEYEIHVQKITYEGPFGGYFGRDISKKYNFRPVDLSDGFQYYSIADIHMARSASKKAADHMEDKELLVMAGDIVSMMDTFYDANLTNVIAHDITKGEIAVVYARGNHEIKGKYSEEFHNFVGADGESFYYYYTLANKQVYGVVLDLGEDHEDDYWEYYDTARYDEYRNEQVAFLGNEINTKNFADYKYNLSVCHIPIVFINSRHNHVQPKTDLTEKLNQMDVDMLISGHQHDLYVFEPGRIKKTSEGYLEYNDDFSTAKPYKGTVTDHNFLNILVSKRGHEQKDSDKLADFSSQIGMSTRVDFANNIQTCIYNDSRGDKVSIINPFYDINYGEELVFSLTTKQSI